MKKIILLSLILSGSVFAQTTAERLAMLEEQVSDLTLRSLEKQITGNFVVRGDSIKTEERLNNDKRYDVNLYRLFLNLNYVTSINKRARFYSTLSMSKYFNSISKLNSTTDSDPLFDFKSSYVSESDQVHFSRAYIDYNFGKGFVASFGRFPTHLGPPIHLKDNIERQGTYPLTAYNQILDGMALSYNKKLGLLGNDSFSARAIYSPLGRINFTSPYKSIQHLDKNGNTVEADSQSRTFALMTEYDLKGKSWVKELNVILHYFEFNDTFPPISTFTGTTLSSLRTDLKNDSSKYSLTLQFDNLFRSGFDFYYSFSKSTIETSGDFYCTTVGFGAFPNCNGQPVGTGAGYENAKAQGHSSLYGLIYHINPKILVGAEYYRASDRFFSQSGVNEESTNIYNLPGEMTHGYATWGFARNMRLRLGYYNQQVSAKTGTTTIFTDINRHHSVMYANMRVNF